MVHLEEELKLTIEQESILYSYLQKLGGSIPMENLDDSRYSIGYRDAWSHVIRAIKVALDLDKRKEIGLIQEVAIEDKELAKTIRLSGEQKDVLFEYLQELEDDDAIPFGCNNIDEDYEAGCYEGCANVITTIEVDLGVL